MIPNINLLPKVERRTPDKSLLWLSGTILLLIFIGVGSYCYSLQSDVNSITQQHQNLASQIEASQKELATLQTAGQGSFDQSVQYVESVSYPVTPIIDSVKGYLASYEKLTSLTYGETGVTVIIDFETLHGISTYVQNVLTDPLFSGVQVTSVESFDPAKKEYDEAIESDHLIPRYKATMVLSINRAKLLAEGDTQ
ncbi:hypothetical protein [Rummeliibacillus sp. BSL5]